MPNIFFNSPSVPRVLLDVCGALQLSVDKQSADAADVVCWQASNGAAGQMDSQQAAQRMSRVQSGGRFLLTLDATPGTSPLALGAMLPTTGWATQASGSPYGRKGSWRVGKVAAGFFTTGLDQLALPYCFDIRPAPAVERGQARYERFDFQHPFLKTLIKGNSDYWTRPLLNREWTVRARCNNIAQMPLLVTGRYGAGKVAVVGTSMAAIGDSASARDFWNAALKWLLERDEDRDGPAVKPALQVAFADRTARVTLTNPGRTELPLQIVMRTLSSDGAILADGSGEVQQKVRVAAGAAATFNLPLPAASATSDETLTAGLPLQVRIGILSASGATLFAEERLLSPASTLGIEVRTDNLYAETYPFHAPGPDALGPMQGRMGAYVGGYAYKPGQTVNGSARVSNRVENLARRATARDVSNPSNGTVAALNDNSMAFPFDTGPIKAVSTWMGKAGVENVLEFTLAEKSQVSAVVLISLYGEFRNARHNRPEQAVIEADGRQVAQVDDLDPLMNAGFGQARITFTPCEASVIRVRLPWVAVQNNFARAAPWLGEVRIEGTTAPGSSPMSGVLTINLRNTLTNERQEIAKKQIILNAGHGEQVDYKAQLPTTVGLHFYRIEADFADGHAGVPVMVTDAPHPLTPLTDLRPVNGLGTGLNVSGGFRQIFHLGTGTKEATGGWSTADDLIWSYSRQFKQIPGKAKSGAIRLYLSLSDMRHYITPWTSFSNGELLFSVAAPLLVENLKSTPQWSKFDVAQIMFADRWDSGPDIGNLHGWQDFVEFDKYLRTQTGKGLSGKTHQQVEDEINGRFQGRWYTWQLERYVKGIVALREAFKKEGKTLVISAQGVPMVPSEAAQELAMTIRGMSLDTSWSMIDESPVLTTGSQMCQLAFSPYWQMSTVFAWGYNSPVFNNWQWHAPIGTSEPSRRQIYDRAWRANLWPGGRYASQYTYGYSTNAGSPAIANELDYQQAWNAQERHSLIAPESGVGVGLILSTARLANPDNFRFTCGDPLSIDEARLLAKSLRVLHEAGVSVPFAGNAGCLKGWTGGTPLLVLNPADLGPDEIATLAALHAKGTRIAAFGDAQALPQPARELFSRPGASLLAGDPANLSFDDAGTVATRLLSALEVPLKFAEGSSGYGFRAQGTTFVVVEDWLEAGRMVEVQLFKTKGASKAAACNVNDHQNLTVRDGGAYWLVDVPLRSGDGVLIALRENV